MDQPVKRPLGLYVHIPFCVQKCAYCDFLSSPSSAEIQAQYQQALLREIRGYRCRNLYRPAADYEIATVFIGGGTPSILEGQQITEILQEIRTVFPSLKKEMEITIEMNPGTVTKEKLEAYRQAGINRLSIGLQSADNRELALLGRIHSFEQFLSNFYLARELGFCNINVDLISGLPGQKARDFERTLNRITALRPEHISAYSLIIEPGTPFYARYAKNTDELPSEEEDRRIYAKTKMLLKQAGYERYEISNYAKPGYECRHNCSYWERTEYLGLGLGAASFLQNRRFQNGSSLNGYLAGSSSRKETEVLTRQEAMEETMYLGLRMEKGVSKEHFRMQFGTAMETVYGRVIKKHVELGVLMEDETHVRLTDYGVDVSNRVLSDYLL